MRNSGLMAGLVGWKSELQFIFLMSIQIQEPVVCLFVSQLRYFVSQCELSQVIGSSSYILYDI